MGDARASRAIARARAGLAPAGRADQSSRSRVAGLVRTIFARLSRRDPDDFARPRISQLTRWIDRRDRTQTAPSLSRKLGQLHRTKRSARSATAGGLQEPAERDRFAPVVRRSLSGQGEQSFPSAE